MIVGLELLLRRIRNRLSRTTWAIRRFGLSKEESTHNAPGLVLIQVDGLSETQFQRGFEHGKLPFLKRLLQKQEYRQHTMYSGLPSSTPAIQAQLFYGVRNAVPAFCYYDSKAGRIFSRFEGHSALAIPVISSALARDSSLNFIILFLY